MSGVLKSIGKAFKKIIKVAKVVLPIALAVGAVIFTGGAALGLLPTFSAAIGGVVGSLGLGTALTGALTGSIVSAGFGSAIGGLTSAAKGGSIIKGMQKGALTGAVTGGVLGAVNPSTFGIVKGLDGATTTANALRNGGNAFAAAGSKASGLSAVGVHETGGLLNPAGTQAAGVLPGGYPATAPVGGYPQIPMGGAPAGGGVGGFLNSNPLLAGSVISGAAKALSGDSVGKAAEAEAQAREKAAQDAYGGAYSGSSNPFGLRPIGAPPAIQPSNYYTPPAPRWRYDPTTNTVVEAR